LPFPKSVNGSPQKPCERVSLPYTFNDASAKNRRTTQYFEIAGSRAIYQNGWLARTIHRVPWEPKPRATFDKDVWELYDTRTYFSLTFVNVKNRSSTITAEVDIPQAGASGVILAK
jgi:arylsulfatase